MRNRSQPWTGTLPEPGAAVRLRKTAGGPAYGTVVDHREMSQEVRGELVSLGLGVVVDWGRGYCTTEYPYDLAVTA